jgi:DNA-binding transcriptional LysR family regulator
MLTCRHKHLAQAGIEVQIGSVVNRLDAQIALVEAEEGIAIIPSFGMPAEETAAERPRLIVLQRVVAACCQADR